MAHVSAKPSPGTVYFEGGSAADTADLIAAQDRARASDGAVGAAKNWGPWILGGLVLGGGLYLLMRD